MNRLHRSSLLPLAAAAALTLGVLSAHAADPARAVQVAAVAPNAEKVAATKAAMRDLWVGHIFWVRNVIFETYAKNDPATQAAEAEVVANAKQIGATIEPFYGKPASDQLFGLLAGHYGAVKDYLVASVAKDEKAESAATDKLLANADEIAAFLSGANPNLPKDTLVQLLDAHGGHHIQQIQEVGAHKFDAEAKTWSDMKGHIYVIADALVDAIAKQFPDKF